MNLNFVPNITDTEVEYLAKSLLRNKSVTAIDLANNHVRIMSILANNLKITDRGARALAVMLQTNTNLRKINLCSNFIGSLGIASLAHAIRHNSAIEVRKNAILSELERNFMCRAK